MNAWNQPLCRACYAAFNLGAGRSPHREPSRIIGHRSEPCLVCGGETDGIYVRVDPKLTDGLRFAKARDE